MTGNVNVVGNPIIERVRVSEPADAQHPDEGSIAIPLSGEDALHGLLQVDPHAEPVEESKP